MLSTLLILSWYITDIYYLLIHTYDEKKFSPEISFAQFHINWCLNNIFLKKIFPSMIHTTHTLCNKYVKVCQFRSCSIISETCLEMKQNLKSQVLHICICGCRGDSTYNKINIQYTTFFISTLKYQTRFWFTFWIFVKVF